MCLESFISYLVEDPLGQDWKDGITTPKSYKAILPRGLMPLFLSLSFPGPEVNWFTFSVGTLIPYYYWLYLSKLKAYSYS